MYMSRNSKLHPATIEAYWRIIRAFSDWHVAHYGNTPDIAALEAGVIDRYLRWSEARISAATCRKRRAALHWAIAMAAHERRTP
jgi:hypothetical protein